MCTFTIHSTIHCHLQSAWPSPSSCAGSLHQRSHTALALGPHGHIEQQAERQSSHPEGKGTIVDCDTTNRRGVGGVWHTVFRMSRDIAKPQHLTLTVDCICGCFLWCGEVIQIFTIPTFTIFPSLVRTWNKLTNTSSVTSSHPPLTTWRC